MAVAETYLRLGGIGGLIRSYGAIPLDQEGFAREGLRTSIDLTHYSEPLQLVHEHAELEVAAEDIRHLSNAEQERVVPVRALADRRQIGVEAQEHRARAR